MSFRYFFCLILSLNLFVANAQTDSTENDPEDDTFTLFKPGPEGKTRFGVKMGVQTSTLLGSEMDNQKLLFGILGGLYGRYHLNKTWCLQSEIQIAFRGSSFNNGENGEYSTIKLLYADLPIILFYEFGKDKNHSIGAGLQASNQMSANMYFNGVSIPGGKSPSLNKWDFLPVLAYQHRFPFFILQSSAKYGLNNLNLGQPWPNNGKPLNNNGSIHNFALEFNIIF
jgi:hypothetical protein